MSESNSLPPRCPCGFWGSTQTQGLCSKCFKEHQQQGTCEKKTSSSSQLTTAVPAVCVPTLVTTTDTTDTVTPSGQVVQTSNETTVVVTPADTETTTDTVDETAKQATAACALLTDPDASQSSNGSSLDEDRDKLAPVQKPVQKNKKRCFKCNAKLELVFTEIGRCKCGYVFCECHRLPEQHDCTYDHKEKGRQEAREKMVSPKKHVGTSLRRLDSDT